MTAVQFERTYQDEWNELEALLAAHAGSRRGADDSSMARARMAALYRRACGQLALATARAYPAYIVERLQRLTGEGHQLIYRHRSTSLRQMWETAITAMPIAVRAQRRYVIVAALAFLVPTVVMGLLVAWRADLILSLVSPETAAQFDEMYGPGSEAIGRTRDANTDWMMFGYYIRNNISVAFQCYAGGIFAGVGSLFYLAFNGAFGGAVAGFLVDRGLGGTFFSFVATHSSFELTAIVLSGAAGLRLGHGLIAPGRESRTAALVRGARESMPLVYGATAFLIAAAAVEAFWSSARWVPLPVKYSVAALCWTAVILHLTLQGRRRAD